MYAQQAAWQRGIGNGLHLDKLLPSSREILQIPPELDMIVTTNVPEGKSIVIAVYFLPSFSDMCIHR
jgi:hypothetical protein